MIYLGLVCLALCCLIGVLIHALIRATDLAVKADHHRAHLDRGRTVADVRTLDRSVHEMNRPLRDASDAPRPGRLPEGLNGD